MRWIVTIRSWGMRFLEMRAKRASSLSWRANFAESLMPIVVMSPDPDDEKLVMRSALNSRQRRSVVQP